MLGIAKDVLLQTLVIIAHVCNYHHNLSLLKLQRLLCSHRDACIGRLFVLLYGSIGSRIGRIHNLCASHLSNMFSINHLNELGQAREEVFLRVTFDIAIFFEFGPLWR